MVGRGDYGTATIIGGVLVEVVTAIFTAIANTVVGRNIAQVRAAGRSRVSITTCAVVTGLGVATAIGLGAWATAGRACAPTADATREVGVAIVVAGVIWLPSDTA